MNIKTEILENGDLKISTEFESEVDEDIFNADFRNPINNAEAEMDLIDELGRAGYHVADRVINVKTSVFVDCDIITDLDDDELQHAIPFKNAVNNHTWVDTNYAIRDWIETLGKMGEVVIKARKNA